MNVPLVGGGMARFSGKLRADQIKTLARGSKTLLDISNDFREHPGNMKIYSFIEQNSTPPSTGKVRWVVCFSLLSLSFTVTHLSYKRWISMVKVL
jgi:hypothetical protein